MARTLKSPNEKVSISVVFDLETGETIAAENVTVTVYDWEDEEITGIFVSGSVSVSGATATARVQAGTDGEKYKVVFKATTTNHIYEEIHYIIVTDILDQYKN